MHNNPINILRHKSFVKDCLTEHRRHKTSSLKDAQKKKHISKSSTLDSNVFTIPMINRYLLIYSHQHWWSLQKENTTRKYNTKEG